MTNLQDADLRNKVALVRSDLNVPVLNGKIIDDTRIKAILPTVNHLIKNNCKVILISHFGRPQDNRFDHDLSLKNIIVKIEDILEQRVHFSSIKSSENAVKNLSHGGVILLENLRFSPGEEGSDVNFAKMLANLADVFINEAFSCSHRKHASITQIPKILPSFFGIEFSIEKKILSSIKWENTAAIIGGGKVSTKLPLINELSKKADHIVVGGAIANTMLKKQGYNIGKSLHQDLDFAINRNRVFIPFDVITSKSQHDNNFHIVDVRYVPNHEMILDIGPASIIKIKKILSKAKTILWNGPLGAFEFPPFNSGSIEVGKYISHLTKNSGIKSIIGGGDSLAMINCLHEKNFSHISTAGGAFLKFLETGTLPGILAIQD